MTITDLSKSRLLRKTQARKYKETQHEEFAKYSASDPEPPSFFKLSGFKYSERVLITTQNIYIINATPLQKI
jgi:hypothetical protein